MDWDKTEKLIAEFQEERLIAVVGASNAAGKFGNLACRELKSRGYNIFPVNPREKHIEKEKCYTEIGELPETVHRILFVLPPHHTERIIRKLNPDLIRYVWMQPGSESSNAVDFCQQKGIEVIHGQCILMHAEPVRSYHLLHRLWVKFQEQRRLE